MTREEKIKLVQAMSIDDLLDQLQQAGYNSAKEEFFSDRWNEHMENAQLIRNEIKCRVR